MVDLLTISLFVSAALASLFMAWTIGAGSAGSTPLAPAVGANAISVLRASFVVGICILLGAVMQGENVSAAVGRELVGGVTLSATAATFALLVAAILVTIGVFTGYPIPTAFTVTGAVIGAGLGMGGVPNWPKYMEILGLWTLIPILGGGAAFWITTLLRRQREHEQTLVALLGAVVGVLLVHIEFSILGEYADARTIGRNVAAVLPGPRLTALGIASVGAGLIGYAVIDRLMERDLRRGEQRFVLLLGVLVAFSAGGSQVGLAVGPLVPLLEGLVPGVLILLGGGFGLLLGAWMGAPRMIKALSNDYTSLGPRRSIAVLVPSFALAQGAILFGIPVSFNQIILTAIVGCGLSAGGSAGVGRRKILVTFGAWIGSLIGAMAVTYLGFTTITGLL